MKIYILLSIPLILVFALVGCSDVSLITYLNEHKKNKKELLSVKDSVLTGHITLLWTRMGKNIRICKVIRVSAIVFYLTKYAFAD